MLFTNYVEYVTQRSYWHWSVHFVAGRAGSLNGYFMTRLSIRKIQFALDNFWVTSDGTEGAEIANQCLGIR